MLAWPIPDIVLRKVDQFRHVLMNHVHRYVLVLLAGKYQLLSSLEHLALMIAHHISDLSIFVELLVSPQLVLICLLNFRSEIDITARRAMVFGVAHIC